jgi:hypothetical protein
VPLCWQRLSPLLWEPSTVWLSAARQLTEEDFARLLPLCGACMRVRIVCKTRLGVGADAPRVSSGNDSGGRIDVLLARSPGAWIQFSRCS